MPEAKRLKVGTFKIDAHNTKLGERFVKKIVDKAIFDKVEDSGRCGSRPEDLQVQLRKFYA